MNGRYIFLGVTIIPFYILIAVVSVHKINKLAIFEIGDSQENIGAQENSSFGESELIEDIYECSKDVKIGELGQFKQIYIISSKGSGNTWTRQLLQSLTGFYAGGVYHEISADLDTDELYEQSPFPGEHFSPDSGMVLGIKSHNTRGAKVADAAVLVMRNPYDMLKAEFTRRTSQRQTGDGQSAHTGTVSVDLFRSDKWRHFVVNTAKYWKKFYKEMIEILTSRGKKFHILYFDALKKDKIAEMKTFYAFLQEEAGENFKVENVEERLKCIADQNLDKYKRKKQEIDFDLFLSDEIELINLFIEEYKEFFDQKGIRYPSEIIDAWLK